MDSNDTKNGIHLHGSLLLFGWFGRLVLGGFSWGAVGVGGGFGVSVGVALLRVSGSGFFGL